MNVRSRSIASRARLWDIAAGALIAEAAGAVVSNWQGNKVFPINLNEYSTQGFQIVAANEKAYTQVLEFLKY